VQKQRLSPDVDKLVLQKQVVGPAADRAQ